jgi:glycerate kinase
VSVVVVAPAAFKGGLSAEGAARALSAGIRLTARGVETRLAPIADGGEGTMAALVAAAGGRVRVFDVEDPLGRTGPAGLGLLPGGTAVVELAQASGYERLAAGERDPEATSTAGTGQLMRAALDLGATRIVVGVGGSATTDGGLGLVRALGARVLDADGRELAGRGGELGRVAAVDLSGLDPRLAGVEIAVACDVDNPLVGPRGAAAVFGPQKGASSEAVKRLDAGLANLADVLAGSTGTTLHDLPRAGAAGGAAGGMAAMLGARLEPGAELVLSAMDFEGRLGGAVLCVTGEGRLDEQSLAGKAPVAAAAACARAGVPCVAACGALGLGPGAVRDAGFAAAFAISTGPVTLEEALASTERDLAAFGAAVGGLLGAFGAA